MADELDPYYTWLGIPPEEQPADHYRLIGIRKFEGNRDGTANAMDRQMQFLFRSRCNRIPMSRRCKPRRFHQHIRPPICRSFREELREASFGRVLVDGMDAGVAVTCR